MIAITGKAVRLVQPAQGVGAAHAAVAVHGPPRRGRRRGIASPAVLFASGFVGLPAGRRRSRAQPGRPARPNRQTWPARLLPIPVDGDLNARTSSQFFLSLRAALDDGDSRRAAVDPVSGPRTANERGTAVPPRAAATTIAGSRLTSSRNTCFQAFDRFGKKLSAISFQLSATQRMSEADR